MKLDTMARQFLGLAAALALASCSGGGCGGCAGATPLAGGFPPEQAVVNAASVRLSRQGLDFIAQNGASVASSLLKAPNGTMTFTIPKSTLPEITVIDGPLGLDLKAVLSLCSEPGAGKCVADIGIAGAKLRVDAAAPNALRLSGTIPLRLADTPISVDVNPGPVIGIHVGYGAGSCSGDQPRVTPYDLPITITLPFIEETTSPRSGYTKLDADRATVDLDGIKNEQVHLCASCLGSDVCNEIINSGIIKGTILGRIKEGMEGFIRDALRSQTCTKPTEGADPPCPSGSVPDGKGELCVYASDKTKCVPALLGTDAHVELGALLGRFSPGTEGSLDFGLAASGGAKAFPNLAADNRGYPGHTPNGLTLPFRGGVLPAPPSKCVPQAVVPLPTGVPVPAELAPTAADPAGTPHVSMALSGRFLDYALANAYNSGALCLGVSTEQVAQLETGLLSLLIPSLETLAMERKSAAVAITTRPQAPPRLVLGGGTDLKTDPLMIVTLPKLAVDFYVWSYDRYVRAFTFVGDVTLPLNLQTGKSDSNPKGGLVPVLGDIKISKAKVENSDLLTDDPDKIAAGIASVVSSLSSQLVGGGIGPIDVSGLASSLGLAIEIPDNGVRTLTSGDDKFVGIFASLSKGATTTLAPPTVKLLAKKVDREAMTLAGFDPARTPELTVRFDAEPASDGAPIEFSYWVDQGTRSPWSTERDVRIQERSMYLQGRHVLHVTARRAGEPLSEAQAPADLPFTIDALAPRLEVSAERGVATIDAWDIVSDPAHVMVRHRLGDGAWSDWAPSVGAATLAVGSAEAIELEARDEEGNLAQLRQPLVRGRADRSLEAAGGGCGCSTPGATVPASTRGASLALVALGAIALRLRRRTAKAARSLPSRSRGLASALALAGLAASTHGCDCGGGDADAGTGCGADCNQPCGPALGVGIAGAYLSAAKSADGSIWMSGYSDALLTDEDSVLYGDLVVGRYDLGKEAVQWELVDGLPDPRAAGSCAERDSSGWRGGETNAGDNVGLWTSLQTLSGGQPIVAYYDATRRRIKVAVEEDGWKRYVLAEAPGADVGRYAKMVVVDGKPVVAFLAVEPGAKGFARSRVVVARATTAVPLAPTDWAFEDAAVDERTPCTADSCSGGAQCIPELGVCAATVKGCKPACGDGEACVTIEGAPKCSPVDDGTRPRTYPDALGASISLALGPKGLALVTYDRVHGNLLALEERGGKWTRTVLDGESGSRAQKTAKDTGDVGASASLAFGPEGTWHVSYVDGIRESLKYLSFRDGKVLSTETVDDGTSLDGAPFKDGKHIVGDDSTVAVDDSGTVRIFYQDATAGTLRAAVGVVGSKGRTWQRKAIAQPGRFAGFFPTVIPDDGRVANFWRATDRELRSLSGGVALVEP